MRDRRSGSIAEVAATVIHKKLKLSSDHKVRTGMILGTGWGDALVLDNPQEISFGDIPGLGTGGRLKGHARRIVYGSVEGKEVIALRGRIHLNEGHGEEIIKTVRLQTEMLLKMGAETLIVTSAVGGLKRHFPVGTIAVVNSFLTLFAPAMPMYGGEFSSPEDMLDEDLNQLALRACEDAGISGKFATHAMLRGPFFEGRKIDKSILRLFKADVVGMSMLPEACVASIYGVKVIGLGYITNNDTEMHSHEENVARAKKDKEKLGSLLVNLVRRLPG